MRRNHILAGLLLIVTGLTQLHPGVWAYEGDFHSGLPAAILTIVTPWLPRVLWAVAMFGSIAAGFGVLGFRPLAARWRSIALAALASSVLMVSLFWSRFALVAVILDAAALVVVLRWSDPAFSATAAPAVAPSVGRSLRDGTESAHWATRYLGQAVAGAALAYLAAILVLRPWYNNWGTSERERKMGLAGDAVTREPAHQYTRAITVQAPASAVWPWLLQMGQDRGGLYSYDWLERAFGFGVHNADRIVPEWQHLALGSLVRVAPPNWLGGVFGPNFGFRVAQLVPNQELTLTSSFINWSFVLEPVNERTTRLLARTRVHKGGGMRYYVKALAAFFVFEPAHQIMEHKMLLTLEERAESSRGQIAAGARALAPL